MSHSIHKVDPNVLTLEDPRAALLKFYSQTALPSQVSVKTEDQKAIRTMPTPNDHMNSKKLPARSQNVASQLFQNDSLPLLKREEISNAILTGNVDVEDNREKSFFDLGGSDINQRELLETRFNAHMNRYNFQRPPFVMVTGSEPPVLDRRNLLELQKQYHWNLDCKGSAFIWAGERIEPSPPTLLPKRPLSTKGQRDNASKAVLANKKNTVQRVKEESMRLKKESEEQLKAEDMALEHKLELMKKVRAFRQAVYKRLVEREDPSTGDIMRCVTDELVHDFMEKFHGYAMPIDAIIDLLGAKLGSDMLPPSVIDTTEVFTGNDDGAIFLKAGIGASYHNPISVRPMSPNTFPIQVPIAKDQIGGGFKTKPIVTGSFNVKYGGLQPLSPEQQRSIADFGPLGGDPNVTDDPSRQDSDDLEDSSVASRRVQLAIDAMYDQLVDENILPSLHKIEKPLTNSMVFALGAGGVTFNEVAEEVKRRAKGHSSKRFTTKLVDSLTTKPRNVSRQGVIGTSLFDFTDSLSTPSGSVANGSRSQTMSKSGTFKLTASALLSSPNSPTNLTRISSPNSQAMTLDSGTNVASPDISPNSQIKRLASGSSTSNNGSRSPARTPNSQQQLGIGGSQSQASVTAAEVLEALEADSSRRNPVAGIAKAVTAVRRIQSNISQGSRPGTNTMGQSESKESLSLSITQQHIRPLASNGSVHSDADSTVTGTGKKVSSPSSASNFQRPGAVDPKHLMMLQRIDTDPPIELAKPPVALKTKNVLLAVDSHAVRPYPSLAAATMIFEGGMGGVATSAGYGFVDKIRLEKGKAWRAQQMSLAKMTARAQK